MLDSTVTTFLFLGAMVASQVVARKALKMLTPEQKLSLMESSPKIPWTLIFIAVAYGIHSWLSEKFGYSATFYGGFVIALVGGLLLSYFLMTRRFQRLGLPPSYIRTTIISQSILLLALLVMFWSSYSRIRDIETTPLHYLDEGSSTYTVE
jgi:hypothetical protein